MDRDVRTFVLLVAGKLCVAAFALGISLFVGRQLGPTAFGQWTLIVGAATLLHTGLVNWTHGLTVRFGHAEWSATSTMSQSMSARVPLLAMSLLAVAILLVVRPFDWLMRGFGLEDAAALLIAMYAAHLWISAEAQGTLQAVGRIDLQALLAPVVVIAAAVLIALQSALGALDVAAGIVTISGVGLAVWGSAWVHGLRRARLRLTVPQMQDVQRQLRFALPVWGAFAVGYLSDWGDHLLLANYASLDTVGQFGLAYQVFGFAIAACGVASTVILPRLVSLEARVPDSTREYVSRVIPTVLVLWALPAAFGVAVVPAAVSFFAGDGYAGATTLLPVLTATVPGAIVTTLYGVLFSLQERTLRQLVYGAAMTVVNLGLSLMLVPAYGAIGAAVGTAASYVVAQALYMIDQHQRHHAPGAIPIWIVAAVFGAAQVVIAPLTARLAWAAVAAATIVWVARRTAAVDGPMLDRVLSGVWPPLKVGVHKLIVASPGPAR